MFLADPKCTALRDYSELIYGQALLSDGSQLPDPAAFSRLVSDGITTRRHLEQLGVTPISLATAQFRIGMVLACTAAKEGEIPTPGAP